MTMFRLIPPLAIAAAFLMAGGASPVFGQHAGECETDGGDFYGCGEIVVELQADTNDTIEDVVARQGGDPDSDILDVPEDSGVHLIAVEVGTEADAVAAYEADDAVESADLNFLAGSAGDVPDTAVASGSQSLPAALAALGVMMLGLSVAGIFVRRVRSGHLS